LAVAVDRRSPTSRPSSLSPLTPARALRGAPPPALPVPVGAHAAAGVRTPERGKVADRITESCQHKKDDRLEFWAWLLDEIQSRPDESQLPRVPRSHLLEVTLVPQRLEKLLLVGFLLCVDILLHELSFTPLQALFAIPRILAHSLRRLLGRSVPGAHALTLTQVGDVIRTTLLLFNVALVVRFFDVSGTYHYIRGESFLKLYVVFNMLEMFERWCRSIGVDLFDVVMAAARQSWTDFLPKYLATLFYCFVHSMMHLLRVLLLHVAINTSSSAVFLIIVTNNFGEIKSTVFKKYNATGLFPIITSDIVERFYLLTDIIFVLSRLSIPSNRGTVGVFDVAFLLSLLVVLELGTDWIKLCLIMKFSELKAETLEIYKEVLMADILVCRVVDASGLSTGAATKEGKTPQLAAPFRGIHSFSHSLQRRLGFSGVPMTTIVVVHLLMLARSPCNSLLRQKWPTLALFVAAMFTITLLAKALLSLIVLGFSARRRSRIPRGLELFPKIKAL